MRRPLSSEEFAKDPQYCPVCGHTRKWIEFVFHGTLSYSDESCDRCGAKWQTEWQATGYGESLSEPFAPSPNLRDMGGVWSDALRDVFYLGATTDVVGKLRHFAAMAALDSIDERAQREGSTPKPIENLFGFDISLNRQLLRPDQLYGVISLVVIDRLKDALERNVISAPSEAEQVEILTARGYSVRQDHAGWSVADEDGIELPRKFPSKEDAQIAAYLHTSAIVPRKPEWELRSESESADQRAREEPARRKLQLDDMDDDIPL